MIKNVSFTEADITSFVNRGGMNVITINDATQLTNQLVDGFEKNNTKSFVEGTVIRINI